MKKFLILAAASLLLSACTPTSPKQSLGAIPPIPRNPNVIQGSAVAVNVVSSSEAPNQAIKPIGFSAPSTEVTQAPKSCSTDKTRVCGKIQVECFRAPCPPRYVTFDNRCEAERGKATDIKDGACVTSPSEQTEAQPNYKVADELSEAAKGCLAYNGTWLTQSNECTGIKKGVCQRIGGTFNECASACRNDPTAKVCTMQCVQVCQFK